MGMFLFVLCLSGFVFLFALLALVAKYFLLFLPHHSHPCLRGVLVLAFVCFFEGPSLGGPLGFLKQGLLQQGVQ